MNKLFAAHLPLVAEEYWIKLMAFYEGCGDNSPF